MGKSIEISSPFVFAVCQVGAEKALKAEMAQNHPTLKFAFSRPGLVTFKAEAPLGAGFELGGIFVREWGLSFGKVSLSQLVLQVKEGKTPFPIEKTHLHVFVREPEDRKKKSQAEQVAAIYEELTAVGDFKAGPLHAGDLVVDVIVMDGEELWLGCHIHGRGHTLWPGGIPEIELPEEAPSRAYLKIEEAIQRYELAMKKGDVAIEVGSAPGGASYALLQRGLQVYGVDPAQMDPGVRKWRTFTHLKRTVQQLSVDDVPSKVQWLLFDINAGAPIVIPEVEKLVRHYTDSLLGVVFTLKLNEWKLAAHIPIILERITNLGFSRVRAQQLYFNRQEIMVLALSRKAMILGAGDRSGTASNR